MVCNCDYHTYPTSIASGKIKTPTFVRLCVRDRPLPIVGILCNTETCRIRLINGGGFTSSHAAANHAFRLHSNTIAPSDNGDTLWTIRIGKFDIRLSDLKADIDLHTTQTPICSIANCNDATLIEPIHSLSLPSSICNLLASHLRVQTTTESKRQKVDGGNVSPTLPDNEHHDEISWNPTDDASTWTASNLTDFLLKHPKQGPKLVAIVGYMPTKIGNQFIACEFQHPKNKEIVEITLSSTILSETPKYTETYRHYWRRVQSELCTS